MGYMLGLLFLDWSGAAAVLCLATTMRHDDWRSPAMTAITALISGPLRGMMRLGLMFEHGNSVGAAFACSSWASA